MTLMSWSIVLFLIAGPALGDRVVAVKNASTPLAPGVPMKLYVAGLGTSAAVQVGGLSTPVLDRQAWVDDNDAVLGDILTVQIPFQMLPGVALVVVASDGINSPGFSLTVNRYAPVADSRPYERATPSGLVADSCLPGGTPKPGDIVALYATGLGAIDMALQAGSPSPASPLAHTLVKPVVTVNDEAVEVVESVLAPDAIGVYRVSFRVPAGAGYEQVALIAGESVAIAPPLPIGLAMVQPLYSARESIVNAYACGGPTGPAGPELIGDPQNPPASLGGVTVRIKDTKGVERVAPILYVSATRVGYLIPPETPDGLTLVAITTQAGTTSNGAIHVEATRPLVFTPSLNSPGLILTYIVRLRNGVQTVEPVVKPNGFERAPIDMGPDADQLFLVVFGTGWRFRSSLSKVRVSFDSTDGEVVYAGPQGLFAGWDQVNVRIPRSIAGRGVVFLSFEVDGQIGYTGPGLLFN